MVPVETAALFLLAVYGPVFLLFFVVGPWLERRSRTEARREEIERRRAEQKERRRSLPLAARVWPGLQVAFAVGVPFLLLADGLALGWGILYHPLLSFFTPFDTLIQATGLGVGLLGLAIMVAAGWSLNRHVFTRAEEERRLLTTGLHAYVRHPFYLSFLLVTGGMILITLNLLGLLILLGFTVWTDRDLRECGREGRLTFLTTAIRCEEAKLLRLYGEEYEAYMDTTGRLLPRFGRRR